MRSAPLLALCMLLACAHARQLQQKVKESDMPVACTDPPPPLSDNTWPAGCMNAAQGFACKGACAPGFIGQPTAVCGKKGGWAANGACKPAKCDADDLPNIANATWGSCDGLPVGSTCTATCDGYLVQSGPITVTCEAETKGAGWSPTEAYCGTINTQALLNIEGTGSCTDAGTAAVQQSVTTYMQEQPGVNELRVNVRCFDSTPARRRLQQSTVRYVVVVIYIGGDAAADTLVTAAESDLNSIGNLINNVNTATDGAITVSQEGVSGDYSGGGSSPLNPQQDASVALLRSGADDLQTGTKFFLTAVYKGITGFAQEGVEIAGPTIDPADAVTCTAVAPAPLTDALGLASWTCTAGQTPGRVTITVTAPNPFSDSTVSASSILTIGTDCVGSFGEWGPCSNECAAGERSQFYTITTPAADGGRPCPYAQGDNRTEACTGTTTCGECQQCGAAACEPLANETPCSNTGKCYDGTCQASDKLFEVTSISPPGTTPANNAEWIWLRLYTAGSAVGEVTTLASQDGLTTPAAVNGSIVSGAPEDPRTPGSPLTTALKMVNPTSSDRAEAAVLYRNNTPSHPPGLFNGMKLKEFIESAGTLTMSWYRGNWPTMSVGSAPIFRFTVLNPSMLPAAAGAGARGRIELIWEPTYDYSNIVPTNAWRTDTVSLSQGKLSVYMGGYATALYGANAIYCYQPLSFWLDPAARCSTKQHPWLNPAINTQLYDTDDIVRDGIIWEVRASALNPKSLVYVNNIQFTTNKGHKFTYVFTN